MKDLKIKVEELSKGIVLVTPKGDVDWDTSETLKKALTTATKGSPRCVLIDMSQVPYIASAGLAIIFEFRRKLNEKKAELTAFGLRASTRRVFKLVKLLPATRLGMNREDALRYASEFTEKPAKKA